VSVKDKKEKKKVFISNSHKHHIKNRHILPALFVGLVLLVAATKIPSEKQTVVAGT
jgi:hypothetical protein